MRRAAYSNLRVRASMAPDSERIGYVIGLLFGAAMLFAFLVFAIVAIVKAITRRTAGWIIAGIIGGLFLAAPALLIFSAQSADFFLPFVSNQMLRRALKAMEP